MVMGVFKHEYINWIDLVNISEVVYSKSRLQFYYDPSVYF